ncbi:unnamed protein product [Amoebophrya sp. A120]|nr:unnamed protein product [Amoebophrya sp. A120]|eukprot:GSA120T00023066001.1
MAYDPHTDEMLGRLAAKHQGLEDFLASIFGFFERRTDLFHVMQSKDDRVGFPPGIAKKMVFFFYKSRHKVFESLIWRESSRVYNSRRPFACLVCCFERFFPATDLTMSGMVLLPSEEQCIFYCGLVVCNIRLCRKKNVVPHLCKKNLQVDAQFAKYQDFYQKRTGNRIPEGLDKAVRRPMQSVPTGVASTTTSTAAPAGASSSRPAAPPSAGANCTSGGSSSSTAPPAAVVAAAQQDLQSRTDEAGSTTTASSPTDSATSDVTGGRNKPVNVDAKFTSHSTWNGAVTDKYRWSQTLEELTVEFLLEPNGGVKSKDVSVEIKSESVKISYQKKVVFEDKLLERVEPMDCIWNLEDSKKVVLTLDKIRKTWWKAVFQDGPEIDTTKIESTKRIDDYDGETQGAIRKIVFDQNQKHQGKPTSDQIKTAELMKDAWDADGSPFKGTQFDPSMLNLTNQLHQNTWNKQ